MLDIRVEKITRFLGKIDIAGLISLGAPKNEYDIEAKRIVEDFDKSGTFSCDYLKNLFKEYLAVKDIDTGFLMVIHSSILSYLQSK